MGRYFERAVEDFSEFLISVTTWECFHVVGTEAPQKHWLSRERKKVWNKGDEHLTNSVVT